MDGINQTGVPGERLSPWRIIGPQQLTDIMLLGIHLHALQPSHVIVQAAPDALNRIQCRTMGWSAREAHVGWEGEPLG
jgi:hypothetical protein